MADENQIKIKQCRQAHNNIVENKNKTVKYHKRRAVMTEKQLLDRKERDRKRWANISEEERKILRENRRKRYANMTEEERIKLKERRRKSLENFNKKMKMYLEEEYKPSENCSEKNKKTQKKSATNTSKELARTTEEKRLKRNEYNRKWYASMTEEERQEHSRKRKAYINEENRRKTTEYARNRRANMTEEQRMKLREYNRNRKRIVNMTEEQQIKIREYNRQRRANLSEEERLKVKEYYRKKYVDVAGENQIKKNDHQCKSKADKELEKKANGQLKPKASNSKEWNLMEIQTPNILLTNLSKKQSTPDAVYEPLKKLIDQMKVKNMEIETISDLPKNLFKEILKLIGIKRPYRKREYDYKTSIRNLSYEINICYLIELLKRWEGWVVSYTIQYFEALFLYLRSNFLHFNLQSFLFDELNNLFSSESYISVSCSMKQLQSVFYHSPQNYAELYPENIYDMGLSDQLTEFHPEYIIMWPFVSTRITLPNFSMTHHNNHIDEYTLLNMTNRSNVDKNNSLLKNNTTYVNNAEKYSKQNVGNFLNQLRNVVENELSGDSTIKNKTEVLMALSMFENDLAQCPDVIVSNSKYNFNSAPHPYARYLGCPDDGDICISMSDQKVTKDNKLNVRLRQTRYPNVAFVLENFTPYYKMNSEEIRYVFDEYFLHEVNFCLTYNCLLCNECFGSFTPSRIISDHFLKYHGLEPDWECTKCDKSFTNNYLLNNHWEHECD